MTTTPEQTPAPSPAPATKGNITFEDVRIALGSTDPDTTHAGKLQAIIGRGSNKTVQIHLNAIRKAREPILQSTQAPPPTAPKDVVESIWSSAWSAAQAMTHGRTEKLSAERDAALQVSATRALEIEALNEDVDALREKIALADEQKAVLTIKVQAELEVLSKMTEERVKEQSDLVQTAHQAASESSKTIEQLNSDKNKLKSDSNHAAELSIRDAEIAESVMQKTIDRLNDQIVELKSLLRTAMTPSPAQTKSS